MLVSISGIDFAGKSTLVGQLALRAGRWQRPGRPKPVVLTFPDRTTESGRWIERALRGDAQFSPPDLQTAFVANRLEKLDILRAGKSDELDVICSRYVPDAIIYGVIDGLEERWLREINEGLPRADLSLLLCTPVEECIRRRAERRAHPERYDGKLSQAGYAFCSMWLREIERGAGYHSVTNFDEAAALLHEFSHRQGKDR